MEDRSSCAFYMSPYEVIYDPQTADAYVVSIGFNFWNYFYYCEATKICCDVEKRILKIYRVAKSVGITSLTRIPETRRQRWKSMKVIASLLLTQSRLRWKKIIIKFLPTFTKLQRHNLASLKNQPPSCTAFNNHHAGHVLNV